MFIIKCLILIAHKTTEHTFILHVMTIDNAMYIGEVGSAAVVEKYTTGTVIGAVKQPF